MTTERPAARQLDVQLDDALWDAIAAPGPGAPTFVDQHQRVCAVVAEALQLRVTPLREQVREANTRVADRILHAFPADYAAQTIAEHVRGDVAWPDEGSPTP